MSPKLPWHAPLLGFLLGAALSVTCAPPGPPGGDCRFNPNCPGGVGGFCDRDNECASGHCCDKKACDGGMCTYPCDSDPECPVGMLCDGGTCYFACDNVADCASGQHCKGDGVCRWD